MIKSIIRKYSSSKKTVNPEPIIKEIPIRDCVHFCGFKYGRKDYNPYQSYILGRKNGEPLNYCKSEFINFLRYYRPTNMSEALSIKLKKNTPCWIYPWQNVPEEAMRKVSNWKDDPDMLPDILTHFSEKGILSFRIEQEFYWLERALKNISTEGYKPNEYGYANVLMLVNNKNQFAYLLLDGNHRVSSLFALGHDSVEVTIGYNNVIKESEIDSWPGIVNGLFYKEDALSIFNQYFTGNIDYFKAKTSANIINYSTNYEILF